MHASLRQCTAWLHTWTGLVAGWVLFFVFATGTAGYFQYEITRWMEPERPLPGYATPAPDNGVLAELALARLAETAPASASWQITLPHFSPETRQWQDYAIAWQAMPVPGQRRGAGAPLRLDTASGAVLPDGPAPRATGGGRALYVLHYTLRYMPYLWGVRIVGACSMLMLLAIVTGVITHKKIVKDFFTFRPGKGQRSWLDAHNAVSVLALPFFLMITYSGLVFFMFLYMPAGLAAAYGSASSTRLFYQELNHDSGRAPVPVRRPAMALAPLLAKADAAWGRGQVAGIAIDGKAGEVQVIRILRVQDARIDYRPAASLRFDAATGTPLAPLPVHGGAPAQTQRVLLNLHEGVFATIWLRWLYFASGLLGCAMIGTGLVLWTVKRRQRHLAGGNGINHAGVRLVENLNVATIAGLPLAIALYFWANRLLPVALAQRAEWELHCLFAAWLASLCYALARPLRRAWIELLWAASAAYALLPLINACTTDKHLGRTLAQGDWALAGFDLTMWALAALLGAMAVKVRLRQARS